MRSTNKLLAFTIKEVACSLFFLHRSHSSLNPIILPANFQSSLMAGFNPVADLKPFKSMWKIKVKIIRLWKQFTAAGGLTIEMVLIDANVSF